MVFSFTLEEIAAVVEPARVAGSAAGPVRGFAALTTAEESDLSFLSGRKYLPELARTRAQVVLVPAGFAVEPRDGQTFLWVPNPSAALSRLCHRLEQQLWPKPVPGIHPTAVVDPGVRLPASATIGPHCVIEAGVELGEHVHLQARVFLGRGARVGDDCWLMPGVTVAADCILHRRVRLQPGVVIGADGFGYESSARGHARIPQVGTVEIGDDVEVGANSTIDRARFSRTSIGEGTKIDNLVQIGHNVTVGRHCIICSQVGIAGSVTLEDFVFLGGQAGLAGHLTIGRGAKAGAQSGIPRDVAPGEVVNGTPALPLTQERRLVILARRLPEIYDRLVALEEKKARE